MSQTTPPPPAGWYADPEGPNAERWWNGLAWTASTRPVGSVAPLPPALPVAAPANRSAPLIVHPTPSLGSDYPTAVPAFHAVTPYDPSRRAVSVPYVMPRPAWAPPVRTMGEAIRGVFGRYAKFDGRASRSEFWFWTLFNILISAGAVIAMTLSFFSGIGAALGVLLYLALIGWSLAVLVPSLAVSVRRLRDAGYPWALIFLSLVPFGSIVLLVLYCQPSKQL